MDSCFKYNCNIFFESTGYRKLHNCSGFLLPPCSSAICGWVLFQTFMSGSHSGINQLLSPPEK